MFELGDPVHFEDEQANAGQSQEQEHANSLMVEMVRMMMVMIRRRRGGEEEKNSPQCSLLLAVFPSFW